MIAWKDVNSVFIGGNKTAAKFAGFKSTTQLEGITDYELKSKVSEYADEFIKQDQEVIKQKTNINILGVHTYENGVVRILQTSKSPLVNSKQQIIGTLYHSTIIENKFLIQLGQQLANLDNKFSNFKNTGQTCYHISNNYQTFGLTNREAECVFYLVRGITPVKLAVILGISKRTVDTHIEHIKIKMNCHFLNELIEKAIFYGFLFHIPKNMLKNDISIII
jgi:DNA-binding CsgD family transcriptional regulator